MKKVLSVLSVMVFLLTFSSFAFAQSELPGYYHPASKGLNNSEAFEGHWVGNITTYDHENEHLTITFYGDFPVPYVSVD